MSATLHIYIPMLFYFSLHIDYTLLHILMIFRYEAIMSVYTSHEFIAINNFTGRIHIHSTLLAYAPEQICLPHCTYVPLHFNYSPHTDQTLLHTSTKNNELQHLLTIVLQKYVPGTNTPLKCHMPK